jgi:uncharacterized Zn-binding protein involved in type VI secretion
VVEGKQAARAGDAAGCPGAGSTIVQGSPDVFINGKPAAVQGDKHGRGGSIVSGASGVFINGKPMARSATPQAAKASSRGPDTGSVALPRCCG